MYANAVYDIFLEMSGKYNIYTLGFFHNITESTKKKLYVQHHKQYAQGAQYSTDIAKDMGNYMSCVVDDAKNDPAVKAYNIVDALNKALNLENFSKKDEYEALLAQMLVSEDGYSRIRDSLEGNVETSYGDVMKAAVDGVEKAYGQYNSSTRARIRGLLAIMEKNRQNPDVYRTALDEYIGLLEMKSDVRGLKSVLTSSQVGLAIDMSGVALETTAEVLDYCALSKAFTDVSDDFGEVLDLMLVALYEKPWAGDAVTMREVNENYGDFQDLGAAILELRQQINEHKKDKAAAFAKKLKGSLLSNSADVLKDCFLDCFLDYIPGLNVVGAVRKAVGTGKTLVDLLPAKEQHIGAANTLLRLNYLIPVLYETVNDAKNAKNDLLRDTSGDGDKAFHRAAIFDESVMLYKAMMLCACDYGKRYAQSALLKR